MYCEPCVKRLSLPALQKMVAAFRLAEEASAAGQPLQPTAIMNLIVSPASAHPAEIVPSGAPARVDPDRARFAVQLEALKSMGWDNEDLNLYLLREFDGNVQRVCNWLPRQ